MARRIVYKPRSKSFINFKLGAIGIGVILTLIIVIFFPHFIRSTYVVTVTSKQIIKRDNADVYIIYGQMKDGKIKVFENKNDIFELKFNSEDLYWAAAINRKYEVKAYGFNIPSLLKYQNVIRIKGIE